jgi:hypothetical protein
LYVKAAEIICRVAVSGLKISSDYCGYSDGPAIERAGAAGALNIGDERVAATSGNRQDTECE